MVNKERNSEGKRGGNIKREWQEGVRGTWQIVPVIST